MKSTFAIKAFVCDLGAEGGDGLVIYRPAKDDDEILSAPSASLIFTDKPEISEEEIETLFETRFPARVAGLSRIEVKRDYGYKTVNGHNKYVDEIGKVEIRPEHDAVCKTRSEEMVARLATKHGYIRVKDTGFYNTDKLAEFGCYTRWSSSRSQFEVAYNPKIVERRRKRRQERQNGRSTKYLSVWEVSQVTKECYDRLNELVEVSAWYEHHWTRYSAVANITKWVMLFDLVFGPTAHRQLSAFQKLLEAWREDGVRESTISAWANSWTDSFHRDQLWRWLDEEVKFKKPRKRKLRVRKGLNRVPLMPTSCAGIKASTFKDVYRAKGEKVRVWIQSESYPCYGRLEDVTQDSVRVGGRRFEWGQITKIVSYENTWHRQCYVRVEDKVDEIDAEVA